MMLKLGFLCNLSSSSSSLHSSLFPLTLLLLFIPLFSFFLLKKTSPLPYYEKPPMFYFSAFETLFLLCFAFIFFVYKIIWHRQRHKHTTENLLVSHHSWIIFFPLICNIIFIIYQLSVKFGFTL